MGVPKFYRWLSERYPLITQRHGVRPTPELANEHLGRTPPEVLPHPDPLSTCGLAPPIDRLYIDMNGIIHGCSHNNDESNDADEPDENAVANITEPEIFQNISYYLDRLVKEVAKPRELMYIAIDGVAPRAKLNQQRSRRYRSAQEGEIERTVYDAHKQALEEQNAKELDDMNESSYDSSSALTSEIAMDTREGGGKGLREVEPGRFAGKFETTEETGNLEVPDGDDTDLFHSNYITPGTPFFQRCTAYLEEFLRDKMDNDPEWKHLQIIFSGPNTPGEGEHKIMQFLREQKVRPDYDPNLRHCIMGQDGDLIMLGLLSHEPNLFLLREQVLFDKKRRLLEPLAKKYGVSSDMTSSVRRGDS
jgi:5'-3' exonuclease